MNKEKSSNANLISTLRLASNAGNYSNLYEGFEEVCENLRGGVVCEKDGFYLMFLILIILFFCSN
jgi:hypothetical protein